MKKARQAPDLEEILKYLRLKSYNEGTTITRKRAIRRLQTVVQKVQANIKEAQSRQKRNYDKKFAVPNVSCGL
jgi:hypothetical protein